LIQNKFSFEAKIAYRRQVRVLRALPAETIKQVGTFLDENSPLLGIRLIGLIIRHLLECQREWLVQPFRHLGPDAAPEDTIIRDQANAGDLEGLHHIPRHRRRQKGANDRRDVPRLDVYRVKLVGSTEQGFRDPEYAQIEWLQLIRAVWWKVAGNNPVEFAQFVESRAIVGRTVVKE
jgi:hypothetical protein